MTKTEAVEHFGSQAKLARAIGRKRNTINHYKEKLPRGVQYEIYVKSEGKLIVDSDYK